jgi:DNA processing protein
MSKCILLDFSSKLISNRLSSTGYHILITIMNSTKYWIALEQSHGIGTVHMIEIYEAIKKVGLSLADLYDLNSSEIRNEFGLSEITAAAIANLKEVVPKIEEDYFKLLESGIESIPFFSDRYPGRLRKILGHGIPPILYAYGNRDLLGMQGVAILGDKDISEMGERISYESSRELVKHNIGVVSGFAQGADLAAHRSALVNNGRTIAFVPYGMFHLSVPRMLSDVFNLDQILIVSVFYPDREANIYNAFQRNKIICAFSHAVYVVEAPSEDGIFEAAKSARNLNIPLFTTEYAEYPKNAGGNRKILNELGGIPVFGRMENELLLPNMEQIIGTVKFGIKQ